MAQQRFASLDSAEKTRILQDVDAENTKKTVSQSVNVFREYCSSKGVSYEGLSIPDLDQLLESFLCEVRTKNGELYKKNSLSTLRWGVGKHLQHDLSNTELFPKSNGMYRAMGKELKRAGKAATESHPPMERADLQKLYGYFNLAENRNSPQVLQDNVLCDILLRFGRRGKKKNLNLPYSP